MSICSLNRVNVKICRRALILANQKLVFPLPATKSVMAREAHSALYKMVKKNKLEARRKIQPNFYESEYPCLTRREPLTPSSDHSMYNQNSISHKFSMECATPLESHSLPCSSSSRFKSINNIPESTVKSQDDKDRCRPKFSYNTEVLRAANCNISRKVSSEDKSSGSGSDKNGKDGDINKTKTIILAVAAALGVGGLLVYFMNEKSSDSNASPSKPVSMPVTSSDLPKHVPYLLIGGGTAAFSAFRAIKSNDAKAKVLMITDEYRKPYMRPPLSKELWYSAQNGEISPDYRFKQWTGAERSLYFEPEEFFIDASKLDESVNGGIAVAQGFKVKKIDPTNRIVTLNDGYEIGYDECLIATGCTPKNLQIFSDAPPGVRERVMVYRTPEDFEKLKHYVDSKKNITIIGNGFIGSELSCSLANYNKSKTGGGRIFQIFQEAGNMSKVLPEYLSKWTMEKVRSQGVCVVPGASIKSVQRDDSKLKLHLSTGETVITDLVVVCVGCEANTTIANSSGLEVDRNLGGFVVNAELEARRNLFVAGDASCFYDPLLGRRRVEHHDHSVVSGRLAGENMVGKKKPYTHQSMFWSDLGPEIGYEGIGLIDSSLPTVGVFALASQTDRQSDNLTETRNIQHDETRNIQQDDSNSSKKQELSDVKCNEDQTDTYGRGVIFYLKDEKIVGILLWNIFNRIGLARTIINQNKKYDDLNEVAKLFEIHS